MPLVGHSAAVRSVSFFARRKMLATGAEDNTAKIWDGGKPGEAIVLFKDGAAVKNVAFSA